MMKKVVSVLFVFTLLFVLVAGCSALQKKSVREVPRMSAEELKTRLNDADLVVIDVRRNEDLVTSKAKVKGAVREDGDKVSDWAAKYAKNKTLVLYCA